MRRLKTIPFFRSNRAVSYAISAVLITGTTLILVLVASIYAYQVLDQQKGIAEFDITRKSFLSFDDAVENAAWSLQRTRSTRFTVEYGHLELVPTAYNIRISAMVGGANQSLSIATTLDWTSGKVVYSLSNKYTTFGAGYTEYMLGNSSNIIVGSTDTYGRALINQQAGWVTITHDYRVRVMKTSVVNVGGREINYIDVWVIKLKMLKTISYSYVHTFDLKATCANIKTFTYGPFPVNSNPNVMFSVGLGNTTSTASVPVVTSANSQVVFNVVVSEMQVSV